MHFLKVQAPSLMDGLIVAMVAAVKVTDEAQGLARWPTSWNGSYSGSTGSLSQRNQKDFPNI